MKFLDVLEDLRHVGSLQATWESSDVREGMRHFGSFKTIWKSLGILRVVMQLESPQMIWMPSDNLGVFKRQKRIELS